MYSVNDRNQLLLKRSAGSDPVVIPGSFELTPNHAILFRVKDSKEEFVFKSSFVSASANKLVFSITIPNPDGSQSTKIFAFEGQWQADESNRLIFDLSYRDADRGRFVFSGNWKIGRNHEIIYRYTSEVLKAGRKKAHTIILKGSWQLFEEGFLTYLVEGSSDSQFRFRAEFIKGPSPLSTKRLVPLQFRIGAEVTKKITIFGRWKVLGPLELGFEITYEGRRVEVIKLLAEYEVVGKGMIDLELLNGRREGLGIQITVSTSVFGDRAELFLRAKAAEKEQAVEGGVKIPW